MKIDLYKNAESFAQSKRFTDWKKEFVKTDLYKKLEKTMIIYLIGGILNLEVNVVHFFFQDIILFLK